VFNLYLSVGVVCLLNALFGDNQDQQSGHCKEDNKEDFQNDWLLGFTHDFLEEFQRKIVHFNVSMPVDASLEVQPD
jgi:hypothetical protein